MSTDSDWAEEIGDALQIDIGRSEAGTFVRIVHLPTGTFVFKGPIGEASVVAVRDSLLRELRQKVQDFPTLLEPWEQFVDEDHRRAFETELATEISEHHPLYGRDVKVVAHRSDCDDLIVELADDRVAVVHLTWSGTREGDPMYPKTTFFDDITSWTKLGMKVDHADWSPDDQ